MGSLPEDRFQVTRDDDYLRRLREEQSFWDEHIDTPLRRTAPDLAQRYFNERFSGDGSRQWFETISDNGDFRRGCVLGAGPGHVESELLSRNPDLHLTIYDLSGGALARLQQRLDGEFPGRATTCQQDLNFVTLSAESSDLLVADSSLHHLVNLEHLAFEANRCLTSDGYFFLHEAVSESGFQFSEEKIRLFEALTEATGADQAGASAIRWPDAENWNFSPFESARSGEILDVFAGYLREVSLRTAGALLGLSLITSPGRGPSPARGARSAIPRPVRRVRAALRRMFRRRTDNVPGQDARLALLILVDRMVSETGYLKPAAAFATYRKRV